MTDGLFGGKIAASNGRPLLSGAYSTMLVRLFFPAMLLLAAVFSLVLSLVCLQPYANPDVAAFLTPPAGCEMPCWLGIRPGVTDLLAAIRLLEASPWVDHVYPPYDSINGFVHWDWNPRFSLADRESPGIIFARNGIVRSIELNTDIAFGDLWLVAGAPPMGTVAFSRESIFRYSAYPDIGLQVTNLVRCPAYARAFWDSSVDLKFNRNPGSMSPYATSTQMPSRAC